MAFDPRKIEAVLRVAAGPLLAAGALYLAGEKGVAWLERLLGFLGDYGRPVAVLLVALTTLALLLAGLRVLERRSRLLRPDRFDLRVRQSRDLVGRDNDVADLIRLLANHRLVFFDGESGSGKSALLAHGVMPRLLTQPAVLPVLLGNYAGDWDDGLSKSLYDALWAALAADERQTLGVAARPALGTVDAQTASALLDGIASRLGRMPVLILDQFDDYQLLHRQSFLGENRAWISPAELKARNAFWDKAETLLRDGRITLLIATRSDAGAGLHSLKLAEPAAARTLLRLKTDFLPSLIGQAAADDGAGAVIRDPDHGWEDLERMVERDLRRGGAVLPQQVRTALLGLRKLAALTPRHYRRAGGVAGVEALYVRDAITAAAAASGAGEAQVRALLLELVERGPENSAKTRLRSGAQLASAIADGERRERALEHLEREELVRRNHGAEPEDGPWQLDHDYLARAVLAEERSANRFAALLRDGAEAWRDAGNDWRQRLRALLSVRVQFALVRARFGPGRTVGFRYRPHRLYAAASLLRATPLLLALGLAAWGIPELRMRNQASAIVAGLNPRQDDSAASVLALWTAGHGVRERAVDLLLANPERLSSAGHDWVRAYVSLDGRAAGKLVGKLIDRLERPNLSDGTAYALVGAIQIAASSLRPEDAERAMTRLLELEGRLEHADWKQAARLAPAQRAVAIQLGSERAKAFLLPLVDRPPPRVPQLQSDSVSVVSAVAARLTRQEAEVLAPELVTRLRDAGPAQAERASAALAEIGTKLRPQTAAAMSNRLIGLAAAEARGDPDRYLITALSGVAEGLASGDSVPFFETAFKRGQNRSAAHRAMWTQIAAAIARGLPPQAAAAFFPRAEAAALSGQFGDRADATWLLTSLAERLPAGAAFDLALRKAGQEARLSGWNERRILMGASSRLDEAQADHIASTLLSRLAGPLDVDRTSLLVEAATPALARVSPAGAKASAGRLSELFGKLSDPPENDPDDRTATAAVGQGLDAVVRAISVLAPRLDGATAKALLARLLADPSVVRNGEVLVALAQRLTPTDALAMTARLRPAIAANPGEGAEYYLGQALAAAAARIAPHEAARLRARLKARLESPPAAYREHMALVDEMAALAVAAGDRGREAVTDVLASVAFPFREPSYGPGWAMAEKLAGRPFDEDTAELASWGESQGVTPATIRARP